MTLHQTYPFHYHAYEFYVGQIVFCRDNLVYPMKVTVLNKKYDQIFVQSKEYGSKYTFMFKPEALVMKEDIEFACKEQLLIVCEN
jgi:hypothetical protein